MSHTPIAHWNRQEKIKLSMCKASLTQSQIRSTNRHRSLSSSHSISLTHTHNSHTHNWQTSTSSLYNASIWSRRPEFGGQAAEGKYGDTGEIQPWWLQAAVPEFCLAWRFIQPLTRSPEQHRASPISSCQATRCTVHGIVLDGYVGVECRQASLPYKTPSWTNHPFIFSLQWVCWCPCSRPQCVDKLACCPSHLEDSIDSLFKVKNFVQQYAHIMLFVEQNQS